MKSNYRKTLLCALLALAMISDLHAADSGPKALRLMALERPLVIGHRGFKMIAPENTLPSFALAKTAGADLVELDYYHSKDGVPFVIHDHTLDRTTDATNRWGGTQLDATARSFAELSTLDAGRWFSPGFAGARLPSLEQALDTIQDGSCTLVERKEGDAETCAALLRKKGLVNEVIVQAFDWTFLKELHRLEPAQTLGALGPASTRAGKKLAAEQKELDRGWIDEAKAAGAQVVGWNSQVSRPAIEYAHQTGLKVWVYTINDEATAKRLLDLGVDGLIGDNPAILWRAIALRVESKPATGVRSAD
jgi:glycerophosphoryl diester phosphodiesterase